MELIHILNFNFTFREDFNALHFNNELLLLTLNNVKTAFDCKHELIMN